jgi:hypothetical protein
MPSGDSAAAWSRAWTIAQGLVRTGRASLPVTIEGYIWLQGAHQERYWVSLDGKRVLRGLDMRTAEPLQHGFVERMARAGAATAASR